MNQASNKLAVLAIAMVAMHLTGCTRNEAEPIREIEAVIRANYDAVVEVVHEAPAEQFRESLRMLAPSEAIEAAERHAQA